MLENAPNMSEGAQVALAAVVGGTAEALSGGKPARLCRNNALANARIIRRGGVANGAVTGAYVMMLNHLAYHGDGGDEKNRTGRKFYDEKGNPLSDENIKGKDTQIIVIPKEAINEFNKALAFAERFGNFTEFNQIVAKYGVEYNYIIAGDQLYVNEKLSTFETIKMFAHFAGEGFAASMMASKFTNDRITNRPNPGLEQHYQSVFTARDYWLPRTQLINFKPWWR